VEALRFHNSQMQLVELPRVNRRRRIRHQVGGAGSLGEGNDFANARLVGQQHHQPVNAGRHPAVRRRAELERFQHVPKARLDLVIRIVEDAENAPLSLAVVNADAPRRQLVAVADQVVGVRKD